MICHFFYLWRHAMKNYIFRIVALAVISSSSITFGEETPSFTYEQGDALCSEIERAFDDNSGKIISMNESTYIQRTRYLSDLSARAKKLFGDVLSDYGECTKAALSAKFVWDELVSLKGDEKNKRIIKVVPKITGVVMFSHDGGIQYFACRELVDKLDPDNK
jgi:hypothetical protein